MLVRLIMLLAFLGFATLLYREFRGDPRLRVPRAWTDAAVGDQLVKQSLEIRGSMARLLIDGRADASELLTEVDEVLAQLVELSVLRRRIEHEAAAAGTAAAVEGAVRGLEQDALGARKWLEEAHATLLESTAGDLTGAAAAARAELHHHTEELRQAIVARREVDAAARKV